MQKTPRQTPSATSRPAGEGNKWVVLAGLAITLVMAMSTWFSAAAVIPQLRDAWGLSPESAAWLTIAVQMGFVVGALLSAVLNLSDLVSPRHAMLAGAAGAAAVNFLLVVAPGLGLGIALRFLAGFFLAAVYPPAFKLMSTWFREGRGLALGVLAAAIATGNGIPHLVNGLGGLNWRLVIYATSGLTLAGGLLTELAIREGPFPFPRARFDPRQAGRIFSDRSLRLACFGYLGHMWELFAMYAWFAVFFADAMSVRGVESGRLAAFATFAMFASGGLGSWVGGIVADRWGRTRTTAVMMALSGSCAVLIGLLFGSPVWVVLCVGLVWGFSVIADSAQFSTMVTELGDQAYVGTALTVQLAAGFLLTAATIRLVPFLHDALSWRWAFAFLAPGPAFGLLAMVRLRHLPEARKLAGGAG